MSLGNLLAYISKLWGAFFGVWLFFWAIRRKGDFDYPLESSTQVLRWCVVGLAVFLTLVHAPEFRGLRIAAALLGLAFWCWPNFAYHLARLFGWQKPRPDVE